MPQSDADARPHFRGRILLAIAGWLIFAVGWWRVIAEDGWPFSAETIAILVAVAVAIFLATAAWVWHNRAIYRRKGPRSAVRPVRRCYTHDRLGRPLDLDADRLASARVIVVSVTEDGTKKYRSEA
jgi:hypothetical protein